MTTGYYEGEQLQWFCTIKKKKKNAEKHFRDTPPTAVAAVHHGSLTQEQEGRSAPGNPIMHLS